MPDLLHMCTEAQVHKWSRSWDIEDNIYEKVRVLIDMVGRKGDVGFNEKGGHMMGLLKGITGGVW